MQDSKLVLHLFCRQYVDLIDLTNDYGEDTHIDDSPPPLFSLLRGSSYVRVKISFVPSHSNNRSDWEWGQVKNTIFTK